jgi:hypothetical protein
MTRLEAIALEKQARAVAREKQARFLRELQARGGALTEFDEGLWLATAESVIVRSEKDAVFTFRHGGEVHVDLRK